MDDIDPDYDNDLIKPTAPHALSEDAALEQLGYKSELTRSFGLLGMIGFSFSVVTSWTALSSVLIIGVESGGPPVMVWSWIGVCLFTLCVAYSMAEMCSAYPVAGGQYSWVAVMAPRSIARGFSYVAGWFMLIGILAMGATNNFIVANFILGLVNLNNPSFVIERWHTTLVAYCVGLAALSFNTWLPRLLDKVSRGIFIFNISSFVIVVVTILAVNDHKQSASFVFSDFVNLTGFNPSYTAVLGLLQSAFGMCCYDAPAHMTEELKNARREAPRAIVMAVYVGAFTGFIALIALCFCIGDIETTASTPTGVPVIEIIFNSTQSIAGASCLCALITVIVSGASNSLTAEGGRAVYAFARDRGLPFSDFFGKVESKRSVPVNALCLTVFVQLALNSIYFGTETGFETVVSIATEGFYISYALVLLARLSSLLTRTPNPSATHISGAYNLGRLSVPLNVLGLVYLLFIGVTCNFPTRFPVTPQNMNYTSAAVGAIMAIAGITWCTTGRKQFRGPESGGVVLGEEVVGVSVSVSGEGRGAVEGEVREGMAKSEKV